jgi:hypothetical protein
MGESSAMPSGDRSVRAKAVAPSRWSWLHPKILTAWLAVMLAIYLGLLSFAAVREMSIDCRREPGYVTTVNGDPIRLVDGISRLEQAQKHLQCRLALGDAFDISFP